MGVEIPGAEPFDRAGRMVFREVQVGGERHRFGLWLPPGFETRSSWPAVVFLHGAGESGTDPERPTRVGLGPELVAHPARWPCVVVFPQKPLELEEWWEREALVLAALDRAVREFRVERGRVALTGMSQGGHGVWMIGARHASRWTRLAPVAAYGRARSVAPRVARLPVWAFHGRSDDVVIPAETEVVVAAIRAERSRLGLDPGQARMTLYPEANHNSWDSAYAEPELPGWLLGEAASPGGTP